MTSTQKRILIVLAGVTALVFAAALVAALGGDDETSDEAASSTTGVPETTTTTSTTTTSTTTTTTLAATTTTSSETTTTSTTTSTTTTTTTAVEPPALVLRHDGLGAAPFGTDVDTTISTITAALGDPDEDTGWLPSFSGFGTCPGEEVRGLRWATMWALFTDGDTEWRDDGTPHFFSYLNSVFFDESQSVGLLTEEGVGLGDTVGSLIAAYSGDVAISYEELFEGYVFRVDGPDILWGSLTGDQEDDRITAIDGGWGCGE